VDFHTGHAQQKLFGIFEKYQFLKKINPIYTPRFLLMIIIRGNQRAP